MTVTEPYKTEHEQFCQLENDLSGERVQQSGWEDGVRATALVDAVDVQVSIIYLISIWISMLNTLLIFAVCALLITSVAFSLVWICVS